MWTRRDGSRKTASLTYTISQLCAAGFTIFGGLTLSEALLLSAIGRASGFAVAMGAEVDDLDLVEF